MVSKLNILSFGSNPNLLFYTYKLDKTARFNTVVVNQDVDPSSEVLFKSSSNPDVEVYKPNFIYRDIQQIENQAKFDIVLLSSRSLQEISNLSTELVPFLTENSIILIESSGFINLEPFLKNCLPSNLKLSIFSIISSIDVRKLDTNEYIYIKSTATTDEIILGESNNSNTRYSSTTASNLLNLSKIFQSAFNSIGLKVVVNSTFLEFLVHQWKLAIPKICFDPLLILFEEPLPSDLSEKILAKPLLSGLITELITVAKAMGCKLPNGYDNESTLLTNWCSSYDYNVKNKELKQYFLNSPSFFYNFYYKFSLDIDMLLLQPILLADDYGIKTPYLEFLYATICQLDKFNNEVDDDNSIFFKRQNSKDSSQLRQLENENSILTSKLQVKTNEFNKLYESFQSNQSIKEQFQSKQLENSQLQESFQNLKLENQSLHQQVQHHQQVIEQQSQQYQLLQQQQQQQQQQQPENNVSTNGTPDLRDLTDVALYTSQYDSPIAETTQESQIPRQDSANSTIINKISNENLSSKELELLKREQLLKSKELEFNKKLLQLNNGANGASGNGFNGNNRGYPQGAQQYHPSPLQHQSVSPPQQLQNSASIANGAPGLQLPPNFIQNNGSHTKFHQQQPNTRNQQPHQIPMQGRRVSTMPNLENNGFSNPSDFLTTPSNAQFKKTSRKNRKSSFPIGTQNIDSYNFIPTNQSRFSRAGGSQPTLQSGLQSGPQSAGPQSAGPQSNGGYPVPLQRPVAVHAQSNPNLNGAYGQSQSTGQPIGFGPKSQSQPSVPAQQAGASASANTQSGASNGTGNEAMGFKSFTSPSIPQEPFKSSDSPEWTPETKPEAAEWKPAVEVEAKPLGGTVHDGTKETSKEDKKKKKFGLFKKKEKN